VRTECVGETSDCRKDDAALLLPKKTKSPTKNKNKNKNKNEEINEMKKKRENTTKGNWKQ
jgi:hypothetical protein